MTGMNLASHGTQDLYPTFLERHWHFGVKERAAITAISMVGAIIGGITIGWLSDRIGRKRALILSLLAAAAVAPMWAYASQIAVLVSGAILIQFFVQGAWGVIPAHLSELSPNSIRGILPGFSYQCGAVLSGAAPSIEAILAKRVGYSTAMASTAIVVFLIAAIAVAFGREKKGVIFG
jgi:SHS family lactate transporter-like MFS transporter